MYSGWRLSESLELAFQPEQCAPGEEALVAGVFAKGGMRMRCAMNHRDQVAKKLRAMRAAVTERKARLSRHVERRSEPLPADSAEQALELENQETMFRLSELMQAELLAIDKALHRLRVDEYGRCSSCGEAIDEERQVALPTTEWCAQCSRAAVK